MSLEYWQNRLHQHFAARTAERSASGHPVFALEHALNAEEREALSTELRASLSVGAPSDAFWLPWIVYASEVGYTYDGEEYWQTFEEITPGWAACRSRPRDWLRDRFVRFQKTYHGLQPSGRWASWFSIIAWPIQHAILPRYLQYHLAKLLYDLRFDLTPNLLENPARLGEYLHEESTRSVKRLQEFAEEHALVGTIATALLLSGSSLTSISILPETLQRLTKDLEREQRAKDWLRGAQDQVRHISLRGIGPRPTSAPKEPASVPIISKNDVPEFEPKLLAVPEANDEWSIYLETPDFTALTTRFPRFRSILATNRCVVGTGRDRWQSPGWLLHGPNRIPLRAWPQPGEVLLRMEKGDAALDSLLRADFLLRPGPTWLFKIGTDGIGYEVRSLAVHAGQRYLIFKTGGALRVEKPAKVAVVHCTGITAAVIDLPAALEPATADYLDRLGLDVWQTVSVWPAGICAPAWDGEGWAEWLVNDPVCIGIASDKSIQSVHVNLDDGSQLHVDCFASTAPVFVALPPMRLGLHHLEVHVQNAWPNPAEQVGQLKFLIRAPRARLDGYRALFRVAMDPERASLDELWQGAVNIEVHGADKHSVTPRIEFAAGPGLPALAQKTLPPMRMPVSAAAWRTAFRDHCDGDPTLDNSFDEAKEGRLCFDAGELGVNTLRFEHERRPLRWHVQRISHGYTVRLVNEGADDATTVVEAYTFEHPDQATTAPSQKFVTPVAAPPPGGLLLACSHETRTGIITPPVGVLKGLAGLGLNPTVGQRHPAPNDIASLLQTYERWATSRVIHHPLSLSFRRRVLTALEAAVFDLLYQETNVLGSRDDVKWEEKLARLLRSIPEASIRTLLPTLRNEVLELPMTSRADCFARHVCPLLSLAWTHASTDQHYDRIWMAEFALRLASAPQTVGEWAKERLRIGLQFVLKHTTIIRIARYIILAGDGAIGAKPLSAGSLHDGWEWS